MKSTWIYLVAVVLTTAMYGCDHPAMCPEGTYRSFVPDPVQGYEVTSDEATIWMVAESLDGNPCLPRDVAIRNVVAPEACKVTFQPPGWVKGRPLMAVYLKGVTGPNEPISFDLYQGTEKKQTVKISITIALRVVNVEGHSSSLAP